MANPNREKIMRENAEKDEMLTALGFKHSALLDDSASNRDHRGQRKEYDRLLGIIAGENDPPEDPPVPSELSPADPLEDPIAPVNDEPPNDLDDELWLPDEEPLIKIHQPDTCSGKHPEPAAPPSSPPDEPVPDIGQQIKSDLQDAKNTVAGSNLLVHELQQQLVEIEAQDQELAMLRDKVRGYENAERTWEQERDRQQEMQAALRKQLSVHRPVYDPKQLVCLNKEEHDIEFVERGESVHHMWKWGCIASLAALLCTIVLWLAISFWSDASTKTTKPPTSDLNLDFPALKELK